MATRQPIPTYSLFGQKPELVEPGYFHVERVGQRLIRHGHDVEDHSHPHLCQMTLWLEGSGLYRADRAVEAVARGLFCWMPAGVVHGFDVPVGSEALVLSMSEDFARVQLGSVMGLSSAAQLPGKIMLHADREVLPWMLELFHRMEHEYARPRSGQADAVGALARLVLVETIRLVQGDDRLRTPPPGPEAALLERFQALVEQGLGRRLTVAEMSSRLGSTPYLLNRACTNGLGMCASDLVRARHVQEAKRLMLFTSLSIRQIGSQVGYADPAHFARAFRAVTGQTPRSWRKERIDRETGLCVDRGA